jgi:hypothetical protein
MRVTGRVKYIAGGPRCFPSLLVCVYKFSSNYLNNIIFIDNSLGPLARESPGITLWHYLLYNTDAKLGQLENRINPG